MNLKIITSTTRPGRKGTAVAAWILDVARAYGQFNVALLDLADIGLPLLDESAHPRLKKYEHDHTKSWSKQINEAEAFIIVLAEYNYGMPAPIKNAIDYLYHEWRHKPIGFVSYGGVSGGIRSLQMIKQVVTGLNMMPIAESVTLPGFSKFIDENGKFKAEEIHTKSANTMLQELQKWTKVMQQLRKS